MRPVNLRGVLDRMVPCHVCRRRSFVGLVQRSVYDVTGAIVPQHREYRVCMRCLAALEPMCSDPPSLSVVEGGVDREAVG